MKRVKGFLFSFMIYACVALAGSGMQVHAEEEISGTLEVISNVAMDVMKPYLDGFKKKYPEVLIEYQCYSDYETEVKKRIDSGDYGDVLLVPSYLQANECGTYFAPIGEYTLLSQKYLYLENCRRVGEIVYGVPSCAYTAGILYNKDVFYQAGISELPKNMEDFLVALQNIKERTDAIPFYTNYSSPWALQFWETFPYVEMTGNPNYKDNLFVKEKNPFLEGTTHYQVYELLYDIVELGLSEDDLTEIDWDESKKMLNEGKIGCVAIGSWAVSQFKEVGPGGDAIAFMPFPNEIDGRQYMTISTDYCYGISRNGDNTEAARAYIEYMLDESGYALDRENLSVVRTDPYPDSYGDMENVILLCNNPSVGTAYQKKVILSSKLNLEDGMEAMRVIEAAKGIRQETFDDIAQDWNSRWESSRTPDMEVDEEKISALLDSVLVDNYQVNFSDTEKEYLQGKEKLKVGYSINLAPFQYEEDGVFTGLSSYICNAIGENTEVAMEYVPYENTRDMLSALEAGQIDMIAGLDASKEYSMEPRYSKEYISQMDVMVKNEGVAASELESAEWVEDTFTTYREAIAAVDAGTTDYVVMNYYTADYYIHELECKNVSVVPLSDIGSMCFAFSRDVDTRLISICNKCIYGIAEENIQMVLREYMEPEEKPITLRRFVEENPMTSMAVLSGVFGLIVLTIVTILLEKSKSAKKQALDVQRYEMLTKLVDEYIIEYDYTKETYFFDDKLQERFAINKDAKMSMNHAEDGNMKQLLQNYHMALEEGKESTQPFQLTDVDGNVQWYRLIFHIIYKNDGTPQNMIGKICNVQKEVEELKQMENSAHRDALTGIYNRKGFHKEWEQLREDAEGNLPSVMVVMDLDDFKGVNDSLGHSGGDAALQLLASKLQEVFASNAVVARFGGDEFMVYLYKTDMGKASGLLEKLVKEMDMEFIYQDVRRKLSVSVGAVYSDKVERYERFFEEADKALYEAKKRGKNGYVIHTI